MYYGVVYLCRSVCGQVVFSFFFGFFLKNGLLLCVFGVDSYLVESSFFCVVAWQLYLALWFPCWLLVPVC